MENFTLLGEWVTPEVAVLIRAALIAAVVFGLEALTKARPERQEVSVKRVKEVRAPKKRTVGA